MQIKGAAARTVSLNTDSLITEHSLRNPIDNFIVAQIEAAKLQPSPEADKRTLARRVISISPGFRPRRSEINEFLNDKRRDAYERLVDKLLASPRYGEHQARLWMDVIRYSDSNGFDWDEFRPKAWRFRDYVIRSFNADKPFDQFIREQLAGDELFDGPPKNETEQDALIATGYLRMGPQDNSAGAFNEQDRSRAELMADLTETTASAFLGLTMSCNRCHDHKYDPLSQADHYRMRAFFEPVKFADDVPLDVATEQEAIRAHNKAIDEKLKPLQEQRDTLLAGVKKKLRDEKIAKLSTERADPAGDAQGKAHERFEGQNRGAGEESGAEGQGSSGRAQRRAKEAKRVARQTNRRTEERETPLHASAAHDRQRGESAGDESSVSGKSQRPARVSGARALSPRSIRIPRRFKSRATRRLPADA